MLKTEYQKRKEEILNKSLESFNIWENEHIAGKFNLVSAGLYNYLPHIDYNEHEKIFQNILLHQQLSNLEQYYSEALDYVSYENLTNDKMWILKNGPTVICTFHTGSYRMINHFLIKTKIPYTLVIAKSVMKSQGSLFCDLYKQLTNENIAGSFGIIDAESSSSGIQMLREIKKGKSLLLYIDGNTGTGNDEKQHCDIRFLKQRIFARKGVAFLAHISKVPILTVACYRMSVNDIRLQFFEPIMPDAYQNRETFTTAITQMIYDFAAPIISRYPEQWEAWLYLHKVAHVQVISEENKGYKLTHATQGNTLFKLNLYKFGVFKLAGDAFLFKKSGYLSFPISLDLYSLLLESIFCPVDKKEIFDTLFSELYENGVLIPAEQLCNANIPLQSNE